MGWAHAPFHVPEDILEAWREVARRGADERRQWCVKTAASPFGDELRQAVKKEIPETVFKDLRAFRRLHLEKATKVATRKASEMVLGIINNATDLPIGGSADLTHSNLTITPGMKHISANDFSGRYIHYGIREHGMASRHEWPGTAWRVCSLWRYVSRICRLCARRYAPLGIDGSAGHACS